MTEYSCRASRFILHDFHLFHFGVGKCLLADAEYPVHVYDFGESVNHSIAYPQKAGTSPGPTPGSQSPSGESRHTFSQLMG